MRSCTQGGVHPGREEAEEKAVSVGPEADGIPLLGRLLKGFIRHGITFLLRRQLIY